MHIRLMDPLLNPTLFALARVSGAVGSTLIYLVAGIVPCFLWLLFYLRRDRHPEPKKEILAVFLLGAGMTLPAMALEIFLVNIFENLPWPAYFSLIVSNVIAIAFIEESAKYAAVWLKEQAVNQNYQLDEPVDFVIYMVVAALGFATVENLLFLLPTVQQQFLNGAVFPQADGMVFLISLSLFRALSAILLHTLSSGILGYYMAMTFCHRERKLSILAAGFIVVSCLHGLYNFSIMESGRNMAFLLVSLAIIMSMAFTLYLLFRRLLKMKSVCTLKLNPKH